MVKNEKKRVDYWRNGHILVELIDLCMLRKPQWNARQLFIYKTKHFLRQTPSLVVYRNGLKPKQLELNDWLPKFEAIPVYEWWWSFTLKGHSCLWLTNNLAFYFGLHNMGEVNWIVKVPKYKFDELTCIHTD